MKNTRYERNTMETNLAGVRAATILEFLLLRGHVPAQHESHVREIVEQHQTAMRNWMESASSGSA